MKNIFIMLFCIFAGYGALFFLIPENSSGYKNIRSEEALSLIKKDSSVILLDVRTPAEYSDGHIAGAQNIDWENPASFSAEVALLDKTKKYIVYCRSGDRSAQASEYLEKKGFTDVSNVLGGALEGVSELVQ